MLDKIAQKLADTKGVYAHYGSLRVHFKLPGNKRYTKKSTGLSVTINNIEVAANRLSAIKMDIASNLFDVDPACFWEKHFPTDNANATELVTVGDYFTLYEKLREYEISYSSTAKTKTSKNWLEKYGILTTDVKDIKHTDIEFLRKAALTKLKLSTVREYLMTYRQVLDEAVRDGRIKTNPFNLLRKIRVERDPTEDEVINPFSQSELARLLAVVHLEQTKDMIEFLAWSGLRPGEMKALAWEDLDLETGILHVKYSINRAGHLKPPKTASSIRTVELMPKALAALKRQREKSYMLPAINEVMHLKYNKTVRVLRRRIFLSRANLPYKRPELACKQGQWAEWLRVAKLIHRPPYQLRHTFASQMLMAGANPVWLAAQMGHSDWGMIRKIYGKWIAEEQPDHRLEVAKKLGQSVPYMSRDNKVKK